MQLQKYTYNRTEYFVDYRLQQFRSNPKDFGEIKFVDFRDSLGDRILCKMIKENKVKFALLSL